VEDRITEALYLELGNVDAAEFERTRAPQLLARPGVARVSWWATTVPGRDELPMAVPEGTLLAVAEVDDAFVAPPATPGTTARHFRRYPRPSQGILTGCPTKGLLVVWISPKDEADAQRLRDWGDFVHIRHIAAAGLPGFTQITPYENTAAGAPRYMHLYELDAEDPEAAYQAMAGIMAERFGGRGSPEFREWASWKRAGAEIIYVNTFAFLGARSAADGPAGA